MLGKYASKIVVVTTASTMGGPLMTHTVGRMPSLPLFVSSSWNDLKGRIVAKLPEVHSYKKRTLMSIQFSRQAIAALPAIPMRGSGLVRRLVRARNDSGKERIRMLLIEIDDAQLRSRLGLSLEDIAV